VNCRMGPCATDVRHIRGVRQNGDGDATAVRYGT
jgi:hypothetical protein